MEGLYMYVLIATILLFHQMESVKVSVYYESLCPDSVNFIARQLYPNYNKLKNYMELELIPFGKATHNFYGNKWHFQCQHGSNECKGNKYQSCALAQNNGEEKDISFVNCVMRERNPANVMKMENCATKIGIDWNKISDCVRTDQGDKLLANNGNKTNNLDPNISFVPTIVYDDKYDEDLQNGSLVDFVAVVCSKIKENKPKFCDNKIVPRKRNFFDFF